MNSLLNKNVSRKAFLVYEFPLIVVSLIIITILLFVFSAQLDTAKRDYEQSSPVLKNQFPISFIQSFLYIELNKSQKERLSIKSNDPYYVIDLIQRKNNEDEKFIYNEIRKKYINAADSAKLIDTYLNSPSSMSIGNFENLLIRKEVSSLSSLSCLKNENYYFYLPLSQDINSKLVVILFVDSIQCSNPTNTYIGGKVF